MLRLSETDRKTRLLSKLVLLRATHLVLMEQEAVVGSQLTQKRAARWLSRLTEDLGDLLESSIRSAEGSNDLKVPPAVVTDLAKELLKGIELWVEDAGKESAVRKDLN